MLKPISTIPEGDRPLPRPDASALILRMVSMMERDMAGPLIRIHQKNPSVPKNLIVSAKKSCISALRKAISPYVQTMLTSARLQKSQVAALRILDCHVTATAEKLSSIWLSMLPLSKPAA
ncbi:hypothetical protein D3C86_1714840 [compost metagenome]